MAFRQQIVIGESEIVESEIEREREREKEKKRKREKETKKSNKVNQTYAK